LEAIACSRIDWPPIITQPATPGVSRRMLLTLPTTSRVRTCDAASGSWIATTA
jgi:hypothetical protein